LVVIPSDFITLEVENQLYLVSFMGKTQTIIYTRLDGGDSGQFHVRNGWICSLHPADFILIDEILLQLKLQRETNYGYTVDDSGSDLRLGLFELPAVHT
jgi:hypothetical protein